MIYCRIDVILTSYNSYNSLYAGTVCCWLIIRQQQTQERNGGIDGTRLKTGPVHSRVSIHVDIDRNAEQSGHK